MEHNEHAKTNLDPNSIQQDDARLRILRILRLLQSESDVDHPLSTKMITDKMQEMYGLYMHRTTLPGDLSALVAAGYDIQAERAIGWNYHYEDRTFTLAEIKILIDAVQSSKFITESKSDDLIEKLLTLTSKREAENFKRSVQIAGRAKTDNEKGYYIVDTINHAINTGRKISFLYFSYDGQKDLCLKNDGKPYTLSPYDLVWNGDYYYLIGYCDERDSIRFFRADRIVGVPDILDDEAVPRPKDYSAAHYTTETFRMYATEEVVDVILQCHDSAMNSIIDHFGKDIPATVNPDGTFTVTVCVCLSPLFFRWVFSHNGIIKIQEPVDVRERYRKSLLDAIDQI